MAPTLSAPSPSGRKKGYWSNSRLDLLVLISYELCVAVTIVAVVHRRENMAAKKATKAKSKPAPQATVEPGYRGHIEGSRKGKVHELFDKQGPEAAWTLGLKLKLKEGTPRSWFGAWRATKPKVAKPTAKVSRK